MSWRIETPGIGPRRACGKDLLALAGARCPVLSVEAFCRGLPHAERH